MVESDHVFMTHEGGTKFYEVVSLWSNVTNRGSVIRRWGSNGTAGDRKLEWFESAAAMKRAATTVIASKSKRGYSRDDLRGKRTLPKSIPEDAVFVALKQHYGIEGLAKSVCAAMRVSDSGIAGKSATVIAVDEFEDIPVGITPVGKLPEIVRGGDWASW